MTSPFSQNPQSAQPQHEKPESRQSDKGSLYTNMAFEGHQTLEENQQHGLRGNIKVKKNKKKEVEKEIGKERKGKDKQRPILEKTDTDTKQEYAAMKKEQGQNKDIFRNETLLLKKSDLLESLEGYHLTNTQRNVKHERKQ